MPRKLKPHKVDDVHVCQGPPVALMFERNDLYFFAEIAGKRVFHAEADQCRVLIKQAVKDASTVKKWYRVIEIEICGTSHWDDTGLSWRCDREEFAILGDDIVTRRFGSDDDNPECWRSVSRRYHGDRLYRAYLAEDGKYRVLTRAGVSSDEDSKMLIKYTPEVWRACRKLEELGTLVGRRITEAVRAIAFDNDAESFSAMAEALHMFLAPTYYPRIRKVRS